MIPKIVHYCWFGKNKKPKDVENNIKKWKKMLPDYEFVEWNEKNFDVNYNIYTKEAYDKKKYAFVSDVARLYALVKFGGVYLDTDIDIKKKLDFILERNECVFGYENGGSHLMTAFIAATKDNKNIEKILNSYDNERFIMASGELNLYPNTYRITSILKEDGAKLDGKFEKFNGITIFPEEYFSAMEFSTLKEISTNNTYTVHRFSSSWKPWYVRVRRKIKIKIISLIRR